MVLGIYGAGGLGREVLVLAQQINAADNRWSNFVFIDDGIPPGVLKSVRIMSFDEACRDFKSDEMEIAIAVGEPAIREILANKVCAASYKLAVLVHPNVFVPECAKIGDGTIIGSWVYLGPDIVIAENVFVQPFAKIGHDVTIDSHSIISSYLHISGNCNIGKRTYISFNTSIKEGINIGDDVVIGMGSVVSRDIPDNVVAMGNPARPMRENTEKRVFK